MARKPKELREMHFGRLTAKYPVERRDYKGSVYWHCRCDCGNETEVTADSLLSGNTKSCGCLRKELRNGIHNNLHMVNGTCLEWLEIRKSRRDNTSGYAGVTRMKNGKYRSTIGFRGMHLHLGVFEAFEDAVAVRQKAEKDIHQAFVKLYNYWTWRNARDPDWGRKNPLIFEVKKEVGQPYRIISSPEVETEG